MEKTGLIERFNLKFLQEKGLSSELDKTPLAQRRKRTRKDICTMVQDVGRSQDLPLILAVERRFLENDLAEYANSTGMKSSLEAALTELQAAETVLPLVNNPVLYDAVDKGHGHPKSRVGALPNDAARRFFKSNATRLLNQDRSRLDAEEKQLLDARKANMRTADHLYTALQRQALGLPPPQRGKGMASGPGL